MNSNFQPFWFDQAIAEQGEFNLPALETDITTDIAIVGGGFTGLWTAIKIKQQSPDTDVVIIDKDRCGQGASGRNGGCMLTFSAKYASLAKHYGHDEALRLIKLSEQAVFDIQGFCQKHHIDAEIRVDGSLYTATNTAQLKQLNDLHAFLNQHQISGWRKCQTQQLRSGSLKNIDAIFNPAAGSLQPAKLLMGLVKVALSLGVKIYQHTPLTQLKRTNPLVLTTTSGSIRCKKCVLATNGWTPEIVSELKRSIVLVSSDMLITEPMPELLAQQQLNHGMAVADSRIFVHYYRTTPDGRLMLGKGGNYFSYGNKMRPLFNQPSRYKKQLSQAFSSFFPMLPANFARSWTGASDRSTTGLPFFGALKDNANIFYGLGYSGNGVVQSFLGGDFLSSLVLDLKNSWTRSPMAQGSLGQFPPEPIRTLGANIVKTAVKRKERMEDLEQGPYWLDSQLAKLAASAGKADKNN